MILEIVTRTLGALLGMYIFSIGLYQQKDEALSVRLIMMALGLVIVFSMIFPELSHHFLGQPDPNYTPGDTFPA